MKYKGVRIQKFFIRGRGYLTIITPHPYTKTYFRFGNIYFPKKKMSENMINSILRVFNFQEKNISLKFPEILSIADILHNFNTYYYMSISSSEIKEIYRIKYLYL